MVGLGNPGAEYEGTRHNVGFDAVTKLVERCSGRFRPEKRCQCVVAEIRIPPGASSGLVAVAKPQTYMNDSGLAVRHLVRRFSVSEMSRLVVVHDEMDLPTGKVKVKAGGGSAGHRGLESITRHLGVADYLRVRIGIGKPPGRMEGSDFVLKRPGKADAILLTDAASQAADAVEMIFRSGVEVAMNRYNG